ncbi:hypothetical protein D3C77_612380 [compost metagenome]
MQDQLKRRQQDHEHGRALRLRQGLDLGAQGGRQVPGQRRTAPAGLGRPWTVQRQLEPFMLGAQMRCPVGQLLFARPCRHVLALPLRIVGVLQR